MVRSTGSMAPVVIDSPGREMTLPASTSPGRGGLAEADVHQEERLVSEEVPNLDADPRCRLFDGEHGESGRPHGLQQEQLIAACRRRGIGERLIDHRPAIVSAVVEAVVHQDGDLVLVLEQQDLPAVPARPGLSKPSRSAPDVNTGFGICLMSRLWRDRLSSRRRW